MKTTHIIILIIILIAVGIIMTTVFNTKTYSSFNDARINTDIEHSVMGYPVIVGNIDSLRNVFPFTFNMYDSNNDTMQITYEGSMPRDFEKLEQIVIIGEVKNNIFEARELVLKCPSKYTEKEVPAKFRK